MAFEMGGTVGNTGGRKILATTNATHSPKGTIYHRGPVGKVDNFHGGRSHREYLESYLEQWCDETTPEDLFDTGTWIRWIRHEAAQRQDYKITERTEGGFAKVLIELLINENESYFRKIQEKLLSRGRVDRFLELKEEFDNMVLCDSANNGGTNNVYIVASFGCFQNFETGESDKKAEASPKSRSTTPRPKISIRDFYRNNSLKRASPRRVLEKQSSLKSSPRQRTKTKIPTSCSRYEYEAISDDEDEVSLPEQDKENNPDNAEEVVLKYPKPPSAPPLTAAMIEEIKKALAKSPKEKIVSGFSLNILQEDLEIIANSREWLIDRNMDFYLELIKERSKQVGYPKVFIFHSFFYTLLTGDDGGYEAVKEATGEEDIFTYDLVFFPVNLSQHWRLVVVKFPEKSLWCYDSMEHDNAPILKEIGNYLRHEYRRKHRSNSEVSDEGVPRKIADKSRDYFSFQMWDVKNLSGGEIPQQKNAIDCGVFCLQYAEYLSRKKSFDFNQTHIPYFRKRMMFETLSKNLLTQ